MKYYFLALGTVLWVCVGCAVDGNQMGAHSIGSKGEYHAPPAAMMQRPGPMVDGPGPGVLGPIMPVSMSRGFSGGPGQTSQVRFAGPEGMAIGWQIGQGFAENQLITPQRYNFPQGQTYRLKFTNVPGRDGLTLYPTLQVYPSHPNTEAYLAHNPVPIQLTLEDFDQVESNNFVTKVIYLPDAKFQEFAIANVETLVSTKLDPGVDPVHEADKRGTIMAVMRIGFLDLEMLGHGGVHNPQAGMDGEDGVEPAQHAIIDGEMGGHMPPMPIGPAGHGQPGVPGAMMVAGGGVPVCGVNGVPAWGMPYTGTPIGLPGPTHLPYGGPAGLKSHTVRNRTKQSIPEPVDHMLIDVKHEPGISLPKPVKYMEYSEKHPVYRPGEVTAPAFANPQGGGPGGY